MGGVSLTALLAYFETANVGKRYRLIATVKQPKPHSDHGTGSALCMLPKLTVDNTSSGDFFCLIETKQTITIVFSHFSKMSTVEETEARGINRKSFKESLDKMQAMLDCANAIAKEQENSP